MYICARIICNYVERTPPIYRSRQGKEAAMMASAPEVHPAFVPAHASAGGQAGSAAGGVRLLLRLEGGARFAPRPRIFPPPGFFFLAAVRGALPCARPHDAFVFRRAARRRRGLQRRSYLRAAAGASGRRIY